MSDSVTYLVVKGTLVLLVLSSALTWALVVTKAIQQWRLSRQNRAFAKAFGAGARLPSAEDLGKYVGPAARVALAGASTWEESLETSDSPELEVRRDLLERGLRQQVQRERRVYEAGLPVLASIGSTAPFVGLFGTVFGIIHALQRIGSAGSAGLDVVAGPIGEALVATGIGIAVAVPAVLAYNFFVRRTKGFLAELESLADTFIGVAVRSAVGIRSPERSSPAERPSSRAVGLRREARA